MSVSLPRFGAFINWVKRESGWAGPWYEEKTKYDTLIGLSLKSVTTLTPPSLPANGDAFYAPAGATGAWSTLNDRVVIWLTDPPKNPAPDPGYIPVPAWYGFQIPRGIRAEVQDAATICMYNGVSTWTVLGTTAGASVANTPDTLVLRGDYGQFVASGVELDDYTDGIISTPGLIVSHAHTDGITVSGSAGANLNLSSSVGAAINADGTISITPSAAIGRAIYANLVTKDDDGLIALLHPSVGGVGEGVLCQIDFSGTGTHSGSAFHAVRTGSGTVTGYAFLADRGGSAKFIITFDGAMTAEGLITANGGITIPSGKVITITDAPVTSTDGANKGYVDDFKLYAQSRRVCSVALTGANVPRLAVGMATPDQFSYSAISDETEGVFAKMDNSIAAGVWRWQSSAFDETKTRNRPVFVARMKTGPSSTDIQNTRIRFGLYSAGVYGVGTTTMDNCGFRYLTGTDTTGFWHCESADGTTAQVTTTAVAIAVNTVYLLMIDATDPTSIKFYINGTLAATHATHVPTETVYLGVVGAQEAQSGSQIGFLDYMAIYQR